MGDIGSQLRAAREAKGLTLEQAYKSTRIKAAYLEAIEANRIDALPGLVQARGFVRSYANYLGIDGEGLAAALDSGTVVMPIANQPIAAKSSVPPAAKPLTSTPLKPVTPIPDRPQTPARSDPLRSPRATFTPSTDSSSTGAAGLPTPLLIAGAALLFLLGAILIITALSGGAKPSPSPAAQINVPLSASLAVARPTSLPQSAGPISITLAAREHVWVRVTLDGQTAFEGLMLPQTTQSWQAKDQLIVESGNAAALTATYLGRSSLLGNRGQVVARAWGHAGSEDVPLAAMATQTGSPASTVSTVTLKP